MLCYTYNIIIGKSLLPIGKTLFSEGKPYLSKPSFLKTLFFVNILYHIINSY